MGPLTAALTFIAILALGLWFQYKLSKGHAWDPLWLAFSMTFAAALFLISGSIGFRLDQQTPPFAGTRWAETVIWWEVGTGAVFAAMAVPFWRRAIRDTDRRLRQA